MFWYFKLLLVSRVVIMPKFISLYRKNWKKEKKCTKFVTVHTTSTTDLCKLGKFSVKSTVSMDMEALGRGEWPE